MADINAPILDAITAAQIAVTSDVDKQSTYTDDLIAKAKVSINQSVGSAELQVLSAITAAQKAVTTAVNINDAGISARIGTLKTDIYQKIDTATQHTAEALSNIKVYIKDLATAQGIDLNNSIANGYTTLKDLENKNTEDLKVAFKASGEDTAKAIRELQDKIPGLIDDQNVQYEDFVTALIREEAQGFLRWFGQNIIPLLNDAGKLKALMDGIVSGKVKDEEAIIKSLSSDSSNPGVINAVFEAVLAVPLVAKALFTLSDPYVANIERITMRKALPNRPDITSVIKTYLKGEISRPELIDKAKDLGIPEDELPFFIDANLSVLDFNSLKQLYLRGAINKNALEQGFKALGIDPSAYSGLEQLFNVLPGLNDIISMAVKEAFSPEIARKFGQFEDFPEDFAKYAAQQGLSREWAQKYWAAHWALPGANQGFEMLHRGVINQQELGLLLKALDVMPYWRDKLTAIAYNTLTRVDIRRLYSTGILDEKEVYKAYLEAGYNEQRARQLTRYAVENENGPDDEADKEIKRLKKSVYESGYKRGAISRAVAARGLQGIGYSKSAVEDILDIFDFQRKTEYVPDKSPDYINRTFDNAVKAFRAGTLSEDELTRFMLRLGFSDDEIQHEIDFTQYDERITFKNHILNEIKQAYIGYVLDDTTAVSIFREYSFTENEINKIMRELVQLRNVRLKKPSEAQLAKMFKKSLITEDEFADELRGLGYAEKYIANLIAIA